MIMKQASVFFWDKTVNEGYADCIKLALHVHDEFQVINYKPEIISSDEVGRVMALCIKEAGEHFKFNISLEGDYKVGRNWAETH